MNKGFGLSINMVKKCRGRVNQIQIVTSETDTSLPHNKEETNKIVATEPFTYPLI